jgi:parvulin-like peptidyl-prolyl isomerase
VSPSQRKRPTIGGGKRASATRSSGFAPLQRLALLVGGVLLVGLFVGFAIAQGIGNPGIPSGDIALVEGVPSEIGHVSEAKYKLSLLQAAAQSGQRAIPRKGERQYEELQKAALGNLFDTIWIKGEAEELGIAVTSKQVAAQLAEIKKQNFRTEADYRRFLKTSHFTQADVNERVELQLLSTQIQQRITTEAPRPSKEQIEQYYETAKATQFTTPAVRATRRTKTSPATKARPARVEPLSAVESQIEAQLAQQAQQEAFAAFVADFSAKWQSRTFCAAGYVIERCANYKGAAHPATAPPACYEANPRGRAPEACPAPVQQLAPARPGTVTLLTPKGQQLPQRPQPAGLKPTPEVSGLPGGTPGATTPGGP